MSYSMRVAITVLLLVSFAGCLGGEERSDWAFKMTGLDAAYSDGGRGKGVVIAILDTGINTKHPSMEHLRDGKESNGELIAFRDFLGTADEPKEAYDDSGHGTHVAGIISARGSSFGEKLVSGVDLRGGSPGALLVVARVCEPDSCRADLIDDAIYWAQQQGADIINLSLGGGLLTTLQGILNPEEQRKQTAITNAINGAIDKGIVVVAAAGNEQEEGAEDVSFPASIEGVLAVGAVDRKKQVAGFSNRGDSSANQCTTGLFSAGGRCEPHQKPEVVAPGVGILSAWRGDSFVFAEGTSQATPFVTSTVALMLEGKPPLNGRADVYLIKQVLADTAESLAGGSHNGASGYGLIQADAAVAAY